MESITIKHRQHYVFQAYLKSWATNNQVWCCRNKKSVFVTNTTNVAQERDFYRIKDINQDEAQFLSLMWNRQPKENKVILQNQLAIHQKPLQWRKAIEQFKKILIDSVYSGGCISKDVLEQFEQAERLAESAINDMVEDIYSEDEGRLVNYIESIKKEDTSFYTQPCIPKDGVFDDTKRDFLYLLSLQHFRTKAARERLISIGKNLSGSKEEFASLVINKDNLRMDHLSYHLFWFAEAMVADVLYEKNAHLTLLINNTETPFVTTDQPIINLLADYQDSTDEVTNMVYYYPISPKIAITVNDSNIDDKLDLLKEQVEKYNQKLINASYEFIFADNEKVLRTICTGDEKQ